MLYTSKHATDGLGRNLASGAEIVVSRPPFPVICSLFRFWPLFF